MDKYIVRWKANDGYFGDEECEDKKEANQLATQLKRYGCEVEIIDIGEGRDEKGML